VRTPPLLSFFSSPKFVQIWLCPFPSPFLGGVGYCVFNDPFQIEPPSHSHVFKTQGTISPNLHVNHSFTLVSLIVPTIFCSPTHAQPIQLSSLSFSSLSLCPLLGLFHLKKGSFKEGRCLSPGWSSSPFPG